MSASGQVEPPPGAARSRIRLPRMNPREIALLQNIAGRSRYVTEFGIGGSTSLFLRSGAETLVSVESDAAWIEMMGTEPDVRAALEMQRLHIQHVDLGPVRAWGFPATRDKFHLWGTYPRAPWTIWDRIGQIPDLILVDGRFRVACCARTVEFLVQRAAPMDIKILVHDMVPKRVGYRRLFDFLEPICSSESLFLFQRKPDVSILNIQAIAEATEVDPQ